MYKYVENLSRKVYFKVVTSMYSCKLCSSLPLYPQTHEGFQKEILPHFENRFVYIYSNFQVE